MTIVEGQIETLKKLKDILRKKGITRFSSIGEINRFLKSYDSEINELPNKIRTTFESENNDLQSRLASLEENYNHLIEKSRNQLQEEIEKVEIETNQAIEKKNRRTFFTFFIALKINSLKRKKIKLIKNFDRNLKRKTNNSEKTVEQLKEKISSRLNNAEKIVSEQIKTSLIELSHTKEVVEGLYSLIAGAIGENSVLKELQQLSDEYYLINDFSIKFERPIYNKNKDDRIYSIQVDHLLVCKSGVYVIETKNWSRESIKSLDLRSPVEQILRTSFALFVLLNSDSEHNNLRLESHHWGDKKIQIRNLIVMTNEKPKEEFKNVKVLSLNELIGYIQYFDEIFTGEEVQRIFEYLKKQI